MKTVGSVIEAPLKFLGLVPHIPTPPAAPPAPTRDDAQTAAAAQDALRARRGSAADMLTGPSGAEAGATGKTMLG